MGKYVEQHLNRNETIVKKADLNMLSVIWGWIGGILFCWLIVPLIKAIIKQIRYCNTELAITNKRIIGKIGVANTKSLDAPLNKIQNVSVSSSLFGKIFNYSTVCITTAAGSFNFGGIKNGESFKGMIMEQIDQAEEDRIKEQAVQMANAMSAVINK